MGTFLEKKACNCSFLTNFWFGISYSYSRNYNVILGQKLIVGLQVDIKRNILKQEVT